MIISEKQIMLLINITYHHRDLLMKHPDICTLNNLDFIGKLITEIIDQQSNDLKVVE